MNGEEIIAGVLKGDEQSFRRLVEQFQLPVINICRGIVHNRHDAEDLAQEVFMEVFRSLRFFRYESGLSTWIYRIAVNKSINFVRKQKRQRWMAPLEKLMTGRESDVLHASRLSNPASRMEEQQLTKHFHAAMDELPENQRIAFTLHKQEDLPYKEIAEVMNISVAAVESLIHRGKVNLQKKLWDFYKKEVR